MILKLGLQGSWRNLTVIWFVLGLRLQDASFMAINVSLYACMWMVIKRLCTMMCSHLLRSILVLHINLVTNAFYSD
jgi:hypothetical protein